MATMRVARGLGTVPLLALLLTGCESLDVTNPNDPDRERALADPSAIEAVAAGTLRSWFNTYIGAEATGVLSTQAQTYSSSWNNHNMNFYSGIDNPPPPTGTETNPSNWNRNSRPWQNDPSAAGRTSVEWFWSGGDISGPVVPGFYGTLSSANDALRAIRTENVVINTAADTKRAETIALLMQGAALSGLALNYDKAYVVDETTDLSTPAAIAALQYSDRKAVRDAAVAKLIEAMNLASANTFTTPTAWTNGRSYNNTQIARIAATMAALTLAYYPRTPAENAGPQAQVDWNRVAQLASQGMSTGTAFDFVFVGDGCVSWCPDLLWWFNAIDAGRVHTRVANLLDPATQRHPYPAGGNPRPNSPDKRLGDGSFGPSDTVFTKGFGTVPKTSNAGTDFAWSAVEVYRPARGQYHQSNIAHIRHDLQGNQSPNGIWGGYGPLPVISATQNDLIWAEALLRRSTPDPATAATLIDKTRVGRGGLPTAATAIGVVGSDADGPCTSTGVKQKDGTACSLWSMLLYEKEIELLGLGAAPFYERRRVPNGLLPGTPREMPVPSKELGIKGEPLYTWGGTNPPNSPTP
ncbi:MAG: hypothetical protein ABR499_05160 [Gemmatimonadaceae bacterium]